MAIPPPPGAPPPPGPPPPPPPAMGGLKLGGNAGGDMRSALLQSIQKGTKLKKTVTNDKSGPALSGRICDGGSPNSSNSPRKAVNQRSNNTGGCPPTLGGLFEGMSSMPKLKPVNGNTTPAVLHSTNNRSNSPPSAISTISNNSNSTVLDFNSELTKHLTLKRQKQQQQQQQQKQQQQQHQHINATEANLKTNRGPPPQPRTQPPKIISTSTSDSVLEKNKLNVNNGNVRSSAFAVNDLVKTSTPTLCDNSVNNKLINRINASGSGTVRSKAANLNLTLGHNNVFVNNNNYNNNNNHSNSNNNKKNNTTSTINSQNTTNHNNHNNNNTHNHTNHNRTYAGSNVPTKAAIAAHKMSGSLRNLAPNKSTLFGGGGSNSNYSPASCGSISSGTSGNGGSNGVDGNSPESSTSTSPPTKSPTPAFKPQHRKPNFAPKPPGLHQLAAASGQRPAVARHHSMKSPRSPPIMGGPLFPAQQHFGTMRTPLTQSHEAINSGLRTAPPPPIGRPTVKPPPPPTPARSTSNSNLNLSGSVVSSSTNAPVSAVNTNLINTVSSVPIASSTLHLSSNVASTNNVSTLRDQLRSGPTPPVAPPPPPSATRPNNNSPLNNNNFSNSVVLNGGVINAPPLPPHRTCPAPPPPQRQTTTATGAAPPVPPQRHSSIRANTPGTPPTHLANMPPVYSSTNVTAGAGVRGGTTNTISSGNSTTNSNVVSRLVIDLETKFGKRFHNVTEFPKPPPFVNIPKVYPSRTVKATNASTVTTTSSNNNNNTTTNSTNTVNNNIANAKSTTNCISNITKPSIQPAGYQFYKKHRAPAPPPQAGVAAAAASVIRESSFVYGTAGITPQQTE